MDRTEESIFAEAIEIKTPAEREAFLNEACGANAELRQNLDSLLGAYSAGEFLESPAVGLNATIDSPLTELPGTQIGPYKLLQQIGEGGMGVVYMAEQSKPVERRVALKIIKPGMDTRQVIARFEAERQALAMMDHPNIAKVLDAGTTDSGRPYFVMELVKGVPITRYCDEKHLDPRQRLELFVSVCQAVQHAHQKGIIHRDIKPFNILVARYDDRPVPKVIDFGVAKAVSHKLTEKTMFTGYGQLVGTLEYMSPEQAQLNQLDIDTRSDIYSLGVLLYELLTGCTPFDQERLRSAAFDELLRIIREEEPPRPSTRLSTIDTLPSVAVNRAMEPARLSAAIRGELDWIVMTALDKDRSRRYETATTFAEDIRRYLDDQQVLACPPSTSYRLRKSLRRNKALVATASLVSASLMLGLVGTTWQALRATWAYDDAVVAREAESEQRALVQGQRDRALQAERQAKKEAARAERQRDRAVVAERETAERELDARRNLYAAQLNLAPEAFEQNNVPRVLDLLYGPFFQAGEPVARGFEWYYLWNLCHRERLCLPPDGGSVSSVAYSPDGKLIATNGADGVRLWDSDTGQLVRFFASPRYVSGLAFSPAGDVLAMGTYGPRGMVILCDLYGPPRRRTLTGHEHTIMSMSFSQDGQWLAVSDSGDYDHKGTFAGIKIWDASSASLVTNLMGHTKGVPCVAFAPDGKHVFSGGWDSSVRMWNVSNEHEVENWSRRSIFALSSDGQLLASVGNNKTMSVRDLKTGTDQVEYAWKKIAFSVQFSPDKRRLATANQDTSVRLWDAATGEMLREHRGHEWWAWSVAFSPDGKSIVSGSTDGARVWNVEDTYVDRVTNSWENPRTSNVAGGNYLAFTPDSRTLLIGNRDTFISQVDANTGADLSRISTNAPVRALSLSGDGTQLSVIPDRGRVSLFDLPAEQPRSIGTEQPYRTVASSPDGRVVATGSRMGKILLWDTSSSELVAELDCHAGDVQSIRFSPDGKQLAAACYPHWVRGTPERPSCVCVWDIESRQRRARFNWTYTVSTAAFSPDGRFVVGGGGNWNATQNQGSAQVWDIKADRVVRTLRDRGRILASAFSPDGKVFVTGTEHGNLTFWDTTTWIERLKLHWEDRTIDCLVFSPDSRILATGSIEGEVRFWRAASDADVAKHSDEVLRAAVRRATDFPREAETIVQSAIRYFEKLKAEDPANVEHQVALGRAYALLATRQLRVDKTDKALQNYQTAVDIFGRLPELYRQSTSMDVAKCLTTMGGVHANGERWEDASDAFSQAAKARPDAIIYSYWSALSHLGAGNQATYQASRRNMLQQFADSEVQDAGHWTAWTSALSPVELDDPTKAIELASRELEASSEDEGRHLNTLGAILFRAGRFEEAIRRLESVAQKEDATRHSPAYTWYFLAMAHYRLGHNNAARKWLDKANEWTNRVLQEHESSDGNELRWNRRLTLKLLRSEAESLSKLDQLTEADYAQLVAKQPTSPNVWTQRGRFYADRGDIDRATADFRRAIELNPDDLEMIQAITNCYRSYGCREEAVNLVSLAAELSPDNDELRDRRDQLHADFVAAWNFDDGTDGWSALDDCDLTAEDGILHVQSRGMDPHHHVAVNAPAGWKELTIRARFQGTRHVRVYWKNEETQNYGGDRYQDAVLRAFDDRWRRYRIFFKPDSAFTHLRLDPDTRSGTQIDITSVTLANRSPDDAIASINISISKNAEDPELFREQSLAYAASGEWQAAVDDLNTALKLRPDDLEMLVLRADAFGQLRQWEQAIADYSRVLEDHPDDAGLHAVRATAHVTLKQWDQAIADYTAVLEKDPQDWLALRARAECYRETGSYEAALADLDRAIEVKPNDPWLYAYRSRIYVNDLRQYQLGIADCDQVLRLNPRIHSGWLRRAGARIELGDYDAAIADSVEGIKVAPQNSWGWMNLARATHPVKDPEVVEEALARIRERLGGAEPDSPVATGWATLFVERGKLHRDQANWTAAIDDYTAAIRIRPEAAHLYNARSVAYVRLEEFEKALEDSDQAIAMDAPGYVYTHRALVHVKLGNYEQAIADCDEALRLDPESDLSHVSFLRRAWAAKMLSRWEPAAADSVRAITLGADAQAAQHAWQILQRACLCANNRDLSAAALTDLRPFYDNRETSDEDRLRLADLYTIQARIAAARGDAAAARTAWQGAIELYDQILQHDPQAWHPRIRRELAVLATGDADGYRRFCVELLGKHADTEDAEAARRVAVACKQLRNTVEDWSVPIQIVQRALSADANNPQLVEALGCLSYRAGQYEQAAKHLRAAMQEDGTVWHWYWLAMACHQLGKTDEAQQWLKEADDRVGSCRPLDHELDRLKQEARRTVNAASP